MNSAKEQKERNYAILAKRIKTMSSQLSQTEALFDNLQGDLESMKVLAALHASQFVFTKSRPAPYNVAPQIHGCVTTAGFGRAPKSKVAPGLPRLIFSSYRVHRSIASFLGSHRGLIRGCLFLLLQPLAQDLRAHLFEFSGWRTHASAIHVHSEYAFPPSRCHSLCSFGTATTPLLVYHL